MSTYISVYNIEKVSEGKIAPPPVSFYIMILLLSSKGQSVWDKIEPYMLPPGKEGSKQFDHCQVVNILRENEPKLKEFTGILVYNSFIRAARKLGFLVQHGRITGLNGNKTNNVQPLEPGEPDIE